PQSLLRLCGGRGADDGYQGAGGLVGLRLHLGLAGALLCAAGVGRRGGTGAYLAPHRPRPLHHRAGRGLRRRAYRAGREPAARDEPALGDGAGRYRHQVDRMGGTLIPPGVRPWGSVQAIASGIRGVRAWPIATSCWITTTTRATSARSARTRTASARAWSA